MLNKAKPAIDCHKKIYYADGEYRGADFWDYAEIFEIIEDYYEVSGDRECFAQFAEMYAFVLRRWGSDWKDNPFNDDIMWLTIALTRAYLYTAKYNFDRTWARAYSEDLGGGLFWRVENESKNTCVNCPAAVAAGLLARATGEAQYQEKMLLCLDWAVRMMFEPNTGKVYDCINLDGSINRWSSTYNQGTFMGACLSAWEVTGDSRWTEYAEKAAAFTKTVMYHDGIMNNEENGNDLPGFKGILARYLRWFAESRNRPEYLDWLGENARSAWENRNSQGIMSTQLARKTEEGCHDVFAVSAAISVMVNAVGSRPGLSLH